MRAEQHEIGRGSSGRLPTLAVVRSEHLPRVLSIPETLPQPRAWALHYETAFRLPRSIVFCRGSGHHFADRVRTALREFATILITTSGLLAVLTIVLIVTLMLRGIRALCRR